MHAQKEDRHACHQQGRSAARDGVDLCQVTNPISMLQEQLIAHMQRHTGEKPRQAGK